MSEPSRHVSVVIDRPVAEVYAYARQPEHLPDWAAGLAGTVEFINGRWVADLAMGRVVVEFAPENTFGVLDHWVTLESGERFYNPLRVIAAGERDGAGSGVIFTVRRRAGMTDEEFDRDAGLVLDDLNSLKRLLEAESAVA